MIYSQHLAGGADYFRSLALCLFALIHYLLFYVANIVLARHLSIDAFDDYSVALSVVGVLSALAPLGLEKYALRCVPVYRERGDWGHIHGFWRSSLLTIAGFSLALALSLAISLEAVLVVRHADSHIAIVIMAGFLPVIASVLYLVEIVTANRRQVLAVAVYRVLLPSLFLLLIILLWLFDLPMTAPSVAFCYGAGWLLALSVIAQLTRETMPPEVWQVRPRYLRNQWHRRAAPLLLNGWMLSVIASSGVIVLEVLYPSEPVVGIYAVAAQTGTFIVLLANTANRFYLPLMSLHMERHDELAMHRLMRHRLVVIGGLALGFYLVILTFGREMLQWFGPHFTGGFDALCIIAGGSVVNAICSDAPYYLQFMHHQKTVTAWTAFAMLLNLGLNFMLAPELGAAGAALGYAVPNCLLFVALRLHTMGHFRHHWRRRSRIEGMTP